MQQNKSYSLFFETDFLYNKNSIFIICCQGKNRIFQIFYYINYMNNVFMLPI